MLFMCSARARRCRAQYDVLFIPQLVKDFLSHFVLLSVVVVVCCLLFVVVVTTHLIFAFFWPQKIAT